MPATKSALLTGMGKPFEILRILVNNVLDQGGSDEDVEQILSDKTVAKEVAALLVKARKALTRIWRTFRVGGGTKEDLLAQIDNKPVGQDDLVFKVSDYAKDIVGKKALTISAKVKEVKTVEFRLADHFTNPPTTDEIFAKAASLGYTKLPAETALHVRKQYLNQPDGEWRVIGHDPITDSDGRPSLLCVRRGGRELWLYAFYAYPDNQWSLGAVFLFGPSQENQS